MFVSGHGFWTSLENVIVGPFIAMISFVCSVGNVPLAAALWYGGISFGGVISFIFADLIAIPLLFIYRRYYGGRLTLKLLAVFWTVMSAAGLTVEYLFRGLGIEPTERPASVVPTSFAWNYTTFLNIVFILVLAGLWWLARNQQRLGGGAGYAIDPVCGMQVEVANAPARSERDGQARLLLLRPLPPPLRGGGAVEVSRRPQSSPSAIAAASQRSSARPRSRAATTGSRSSLGEGADAPGAFVGPARQALAFGLRGAPEEAGPLEVAAGERDLREAGERVEGPQPVLLRALHLERDEPFSLRLVEIPRRSASIRSSCRWPDSHHDPAAPHAPSRCPVA